jgi:hypothetical protein
MVVICPLDSRECEEEMEAIEHAVTEASKVDPNNPMLPAPTIILASDPRALQTLGLCLVGNQKKPLIE